MAGWIDRLRGLFTKSPGRVTGTFVGEVEGTDALIAVVASERDAVAFVCNGRQLVRTPDTIAEWFRGERPGDRIELRSDTGAVLTATVTGDAAEGSVMLGDRGRGSFTARRAEGRAGLYRAELTDERPPVLVGSIVLADGTVRSSSNLDHQNRCNELHDRILVLANKVREGSATWDETLEAGAVGDIYFRRCLEGTD